MLVSWTYANVKRDVPGVIFIIAMFAAIYVCGRPSNTIPIRSVDPVDATVKSLAWDGIKTYALLLENDSMVFVQDDRPYLLGSHVAIERVTRNDGSVFYRFPE
ncbi:hypothetical protein DPM33_06645 [Mesorhizobium hawassense]|uniref:Uncharacterized protein n=1 Tax=Mesorhizobium hawassense TaxID=1209954 RepID=A0A330HV28_9HYPH|nr:hypothetical protein [Mesorhizobium hawassense]RAZ92113.1 hypothetical protein DPM33_06645 [Mesorhizobium hawassense]